MNKLNIYLIILDYPRGVTKASPNAIHRFDIPRLRSGQELLRRGAWVGSLRHSRAIEIHYSEIIICSFFTLLRSLAVVSTGCFWVLFQTMFSFLVIHTEGELSASISPVGRCTKRGKLFMCYGMGLDMANHV